MSDVVSKSVCTHAATCELFPQFAKKALLRVWQINYCEDDYQACARFQRSLEGRDVPGALLPNGETLRLWKPSSQK